MKRCHVVGALLGAVVPVHPFCFSESSTVPRHAAKVCPARTQYTTTTTWLEPEDIIIVSSVVGRFD